jgi:DNA-binding response OmpR family regulator
MDGFTVCRTLRKESAVPIIMFSTRGNVQDRIKGLELGADDYVVKSFNARELMARVRALLRRWQLDRRPTSASRDRVVVGDIVLDRAAARSGEPAT